MKAVTLSDHVDFLSGFAFKSVHFNTEGRGLPIVRIRDVVMGRSDTFYAGEYESHHLVDDGDYLIGMDGEFNLAKWRGGKALLNQRVCKIGSVSEQIDRDFLARFLTGALKRIEAKTPYVTVKHLSVKSLAALELRLPPIAEQKRIAEILDKADELKAKRQQAIDELDKLQQAVFLDMFGSPITNPKGWPMGVIGDLLSSTSYGTSKKAHDSEGAFPVLRMGNLTYSGSIDTSELKYIDLDEKDLPKHLVTKGELLFNRTNSKELVGKTAVYRLDEPMAYAGYLVKGVPNDDCNIEYLGAFMNLATTKQLLRNKCRNIVGMANINAKEFAAIPVPMPSRALQDKFGECIASLEVTRARYREHIAELTELSGSLQSRAFRGEL